MIYFLKVVNFGRGPTYLKTEKGKQLCVLPLLYGLYLSKQSMFLHKSIPTTKLKKKRILLFCNHQWTAAKIIRRATTRQDVPVLILPDTVHSLARGIETEDTEHSAACGPEP